MTERSDTQLFAALLLVSCALAFVLGKESDATDPVIESAARAEFWARRDCEAAAGSFWRDLVHSSSDTYGWHFNRSQQTCYMQVTQGDMDTIYNPVDRVEIARRYGNPVTYIWGERIERSNRTAFTFAKLMLE